MVRLSSWHKQSHCQLPFLRMKTKNEYKITLYCFCYQAPAESRLPAETKLLLSFTAYLCLPVTPGGQTVKPAFQLHGSFIQLSFQTCSHLTQVCMFAQVLQIKQERITTKQSKQRTEKDRRYDSCV